jgi:alpha-galactosidase
MLLNAQEVAVWKNNILTLDNGIVKREIGFENNKIATKSITLKDDDFNFISKPDEFSKKVGSEENEFSFLIDGKYYDGLSGWQFVSYSPATDSRQGQGATLRLKGMHEISSIEVAITYLLYPQLPVIRKQVTILNQSGNEIKLESLDVEKLRFSFNYIPSVCYANYCRQKHLSTYIGNWDDPVLAIHSYEISAGILLGNEAPGAIKRTDYNTLWDNADIGLSHAEDIYPFRKYIKAGDSWTSPRVFIIPYTKTSDPWLIMNGALADFERKYMGLKIFENKNLPTFMYNTWNPFRDEFSDTLLISLAKAASKCGIRQFVIDDGWHINIDNLDKKVSSFEKCGDWIIDKKKFPKGLKPVFDKVRELGMEPGLWISVGTAASTAKVYKDHPEWMVQDKNGKHVCIHGEWEPGDALTACLGTEYTTYIKEKILNLVKEYKLAYVKLDLTVATSAYVMDKNKSGCYAKDHPYHKDREESFIAIYTRLFQLFDDLHKEAPGLYIDCTFETEGKLQLIDYAFCEHAEGNWLTNIEDPYPVGAFRIRNLAWWKCPALPASSMIIGNLRLDDKDVIEELKTLIGTFPIILGDPRAIPDAKKAEIKQWGDWIVNMQKKYNYMSFRQDIPGFGEPVEGGWDAWSRVNTDNKSGGIVGVFKQGSLDNSRTVSIPGLEKNTVYSVKSAPGGKEIARMTGKVLEEKGFLVKMDKKYDSQIFEVSMVR